MTLFYSNQLELDRLVERAGSQFAQLLTDDGTPTGNPSLANTGNVTVYVEGPLLITQLSFVMRDNTALINTSLGSQAAPSNPVVVSKVPPTGPSKVFLSAALNPDFSQIFESNSADLIGSAFFLSGILNFVRIWGTPLVLRTGEKLQVNKNDDLSGLTRFQFYAAGHVL